MIRLAGAGVLAVALGLAAPVYAQDGGVDASTALDVDASAGADASVGAAGDSGAVTDTDAAIADAGIDIFADAATLVAPEHDRDHDHADHDHADHHHDHTHGDHVHDLSGAPVFGAHAHAHAAPLAASTSDLELPLEPFRAVPRPSAEAALALAPSAYLVNHNGTYHASSVYLRGFDTGEGQDLEVLADGIPLNEPSNAHGHGYADAHFLIPELVSSVRVTEGPFAPRQSDFAVAGSAEYVLGMERRGLIASADYGSFDQKRLLLVWAPPGASNGTYIGVDLRDADGYGVNRGSTSGVVNARWEGALSSAMRLHVFFAAQLADWQSAGVVRADDVDAARLPCAPDRDSQFFCTRDPNQGGESQRVLGGVGVAWRIGHGLLEASLFGGMRHLRVRENFTGLIHDVRGDGQDERYDVGTLGFRADYHLHFALFGRAQTFETGVVARHDTGHTELDRVRFGLGVPYQAQFDDELHVTHIGAHVATDLRFLDALSLRLGLRADVFGFATVEHALPTMDRVGPRLPLQPTDALGVALQPRGTVRVTLTRGLDWQTSVGVGARSSDAIALSEGELAPFATVIAAESGLAFSLREHDFQLDARAAAFHTHVDHDLVFDEARGRNVDVGASSRLGALAWAHVALFDRLHVMASFAWTEAYLLGPSATASYFDFVSDTRLPYVPRWTGRLDAAGHQPFDVAGEPFVALAGVGLGWLGERPLPIGEAAPQSVILDASLGLRWRSLEVALLVQNLLDTRAYASVFRYASQWDPAAPVARVPELHYSAAPPFSILLRLTIHLDPSVLR